MRSLPYLAAIALLVTACSRNETPPAASPASETPPASESAAAPSADAGVSTEAHTATLAPTEGRQAAGTLGLTADGNAVRITGRITGLTAAAEHGFHVHEKGDCSAPDASSAGGHFNPDAMAHGNPSMGPHHAGDMFNLRADAQGNAEVDTRVEGVTLGDGGPNDLVGKAIVVHEKADDYASQPSGNSGARIACGVIE